MRYLCGIDLKWNHFKGFSLLSWNVACDEINAIIRRIKAGLRFRFTFYLIWWWFVIFIAHLLKEQFDIWQTNFTSGKYKTKGMSLLAWKHGHKDMNNIKDLFI